MWKCTKKSRPVDVPPLNCTNLLKQRKILTYTNHRRSLRHWVRVRVSILYALNWQNFCWSSNILEVQWTFRQRSKHPSFVQNVYCALMYMRQFLQGQGETSGRKAWDQGNDETVFCLGQNSFLNHQLIYAANAMNHSTTDKLQAHCSVITEERSSCPQSALNVFTVKFYCVNYLEDCYQKISPVCLYLGVFVGSYTTRIV